MIWLDNQFDTEPWPYEPSTYELIKISSRRAGKSIQQVGNHIHVTMTPVFYNFNTAIQDSNRRLGHQLFPPLTQGDTAVYDSDHQAPTQRYRENPPRFQPRGRIFDRRGRKRY